MQTVSLNISNPPTRYEVRIAADLLDQVGSMVADVCPHDRAAVVCDRAIADTHGQTVVNSMSASGYDVVKIAIEANEEFKSLDTVAHLYGEFASAQLDRQTPVIGVGGGVTGDTVGFAAATFMRGLPFINIPTTLLAMVDASVGGKTGVNFAPPASANRTPQTLVKNLIGSFHQPLLVMADVTTLESLPERHIRCGLAECIKHAIIGDPRMFGSLQDESANFGEWDEAKRVEFIARNIRVKADVVERDARESRLRMVLNLGHTFAHAIETRPELDLWHGEAVALGLIAAAEAGVAMRMTAPTTCDAIRRTVESTGLPIRIGNLPPGDDLITTMRGDKKSASGRIRLIIPREIGSVEIVDDVPISAIRAGWDRLCL